MAYDIYGNSLRRGYCEVHPNVHEEYPCTLCNQDAINYRDMEREREHYTELERQYYEDSK